MMKKCMFLMVFLALGSNGRAIDRKYDFTARAGRAELTYSEKAGLVVPFNCIVHVSAAGGFAGATSELGLGVSAKTFRPILKGLPSRVKAEGRDEKELGVFGKGASIPLALRTKWWNKVHFAFVGKRDVASRIAFFDVYRKGVLPKPVFKKVGRNTWQLRLDDAASHLVDDNEGDIVIRIRIERLGEGFAN